MPTGGRRRDLAVTAPPPPGRAGPECAVRNRLRGYTIAEILVVVGIVAVLAALILPGIGATQRRARDSVCVSHLAQVGHAASMYTQDYDGLYMWALDAADRHVPGLWSTEPDFAAQIPKMAMVHEVLVPYVRSRDLFSCPADTGYDVADFSGYPLDGRPTAFAQFGTSYNYRTELCVRHAGPASVSAPSVSPVLFDAAGNWHGASETQGYRYAVLVADGRVVTMTRDRLDRLFAFPP